MNVTGVILQPCDVMRKRPEAFQPASTHTAAAAAAPSVREGGLQSVYTTCNYDDSRLTTAGILDVDYMGFTTLKGCLKLGMIKGLHQDFTT